MANHIAPVLRKWALPKRRRPHLSLSPAVGKVQRGRSSRSKPIAGHQNENERPEFGLREKLSKQPAAQISTDNFPRTVHRHHKTIAGATLQIVYNNTTPISMTLYLHNLWFQNNAASLTMQSGRPGVAAASRCRTPSQHRRSIGMDAVWKHGAELTRERQQYHFAMTCTGTVPGKGLPCHTIPATLPTYYDALEHIIHYVHNTKRRR